MAFLVSFQLDRTVFTAAVRRRSSRSLSCCDCSSGAMKAVARVWKSGVSVHPRMLCMQSRTFSQNLLTFGQYRMRCERSPFCLWQFQQRSLSESPTVARRAGVQKDLCSSQYFVCARAGEILFCEAEAHSRCLSLSLKERLLWASQSLIALLLI